MGGWEERDFYVFILINYIIYHPTHTLSTTSINIQTVNEQLVCVFKRIVPLTKIFWKQFYVSLNACFYWSPKISSNKTAYDGDLLEVIKPSITCHQWKDSKRTTSVFRWVTLFHLDSVFHQSFTGNLPHLTFFSFLWLTNSITFINL